MAGQILTWGDHLGYTDRKMVNEVMILRGLPGCGKSYFVRELRRHGREVMVVSADDYFQRNGYRFDPTELGEAHKACFRRYLEAVTGRKRAADILVVDNTNIQLWELSPYVAVANAMDVPYEVVHIRCPVEVSIRRNVHHVPAESIRRMARDFEPAPPFWPSTVVDN